MTPDLSQIPMFPETIYNQKQHTHRPGYDAEYRASHKTERAEYMRDWRAERSYNRLIIAVDGEGKNTGKVYYHCKKDANGAEILFTGSDEITPPKTRAAYKKRPDLVFYRGENNDGSMRLMNGAWLAREHIYTRLTASTGASIYNDAGLPTVDCLDFLLSLYEPGALYVSFAFSYDINMMLGDLPEKTLKTLHKETSVVWNGYRLTWIPRKTLSITKDKRTVTIWDVFGYFQKSFVDSLDEWAIGSPETRQQIRDMKAQRGDFASVDNDEIAAYCADECRLLVLLVEKTLATVDKLDIRLKRYDGAGSIAAGIMEKYDVASYLQSRQLDESRGLLAYFGGRFELSAPGFYPRLWQYDINSAYPAALYQLPCLTHCEWRHSYHWQGELGLVKVQWDLNAEIAHINQLMPFPYRIPKGQSKGEIVYPIRGIGWYWSHEIKAAMRLYPGAIAPLECWLYEPECTHIPFAHIPELYETRRQLKASGDLGNLILKLGYNSEYGKTAQSVGFKQYKPKYRNWLAASFITSYCRANILDAVRLADGNVIEIATDGVMSVAPITGLPLSKQLGEWDVSTYDDCLLVRPNLYFAGDKIKASGLAKDELDAAKIRADFLDYGPKSEFMATTRRFMGLDIALMRNCLDTGWRCWTEERKRVRPEQHNRIYYYEQNGPPFTTLLTEPFDGIFEDSQAYQYKLEWSDSFENHVMSDWLNQP